MQDLAAVISHTLIQNKKLIDELKSENTVLESKLLIVSNDQLELK